jgi:SAM-dependent methyltransferase
MTIFGDSPTVRPTVNRMGWGSEFAHEINLAFAEFAATCKHPVLDIGAGYGAATLAALMVGATVIANDLDNSHLESLAASIPSEMRNRVEMLSCRFPQDLTFPSQHFGAIHASNVLHFLTLSELEAGIKLMFQWLVPKGKVFVMASSPYQQSYTNFIPVFEQRKMAGVRWPGWIEDLTQYSSHPTLQYLPKSLNCFDAEVISRAFLAEGFIIEIAREFTRTGIPQNLRYDGRENVMLVARK